MNRKWWKEAVVYQVYPRSFKDSNGDGIGDLPGIIQKLDHIKSLGVDVVWLSPIYKSPNDDNGYDISDYYDIMEEFGTMHDFDELLAGIHERGMKLLMDLVVNHSSDEHEWFKESRSSKDNPKRDYYIWKPGKEGGPPNNWQSFFSGSTWEYDEHTEEYYLHLFTKKQPDLNWENPQVRAEIHRMMRFWLDKGVDGFRMDVISLLSKRNYDDSPYADLNDAIDRIYSNGPKIHEYLKAMNQEVLSKYDIMTVGEGPGIDLENGIKYVAESEEELNMVFHFGHMFMDHGKAGRFDPQPIDFVEFKRVFTLWDEQLKAGGWGSIFLGNHDFPRIVSRFGSDQAYWSESAKLLCLLLMTMRGTPYIYNGDEVGMTNVVFDQIEDHRDVETKNALKEWKAQGKDLQEFIKNVHTHGRDNARTPMQWSDAANAGFGEADPWIRVNPNFEHINVQAQENDSDSILNFYRQMVSVRKANSSLVYADYLDLEPAHQHVFAYRRKDEENEFLVVLNFSDKQEAYSVGSEFRKLIGNYDSLQYSEGTLALRPWESVLFQKT